ncbi:MAG: hypothetical protein IH957_06480 [Chloroflexi bacterium]|nr:hypothetical protein [Chloroflexota bacterium]
MRRSGSVVIVGAALTLFAAACGGGDGAEPTVSPSESPTVTATPPKTTPPLPTVTLTPVAREPMEQLTYVGAEGEIRLVDADGTDDRVFVEDPCEDSPSGNPFWLAWSPGGRHLAYICSEPNGLNQVLVVVDSSGEEVQWLSASRFKWSPDGEHIALEADRVADDRGFVVEVLDVATGSTVRLVDDGLLMEWVGGDRVLVGVEPEFLDLGVTFRAQVADAGTGASEPLPRFDNVLEFWVSPDGAKAIVLTEWSTEHNGIGMAVYDFATGRETEIEGGYIGFPSEHIPDSQLAFSRDGSMIYWGNATDVSSAPFWRALVLEDVPIAVELARLPWTGPVSPEGRVAYFDLTSDAERSLFLVADLITGTKVEIDINSSKSEVAWRTPPTLEVPSTRVAGDDPRVLEAAARPGLLEFAAEFQTAIRANDVEYIFQRAHYGEFECRDSGGFPAQPRNCSLQPAGLVVPAISYGIWNSEGGYCSPEQYAEFVVDNLARKAAPDAQMYAFGHHIRAASEADGGVDIVVADVRSSSGGGSAPGAAVVFRAATVEGEWKIVGVKIGGVGLIDGFFDWWVPWREAFPEAAGG